MRVVFISKLCGYAYRNTFQQSLPLNTTPKTVLAAPYLLPWSMEQYKTLYRWTLTPTPLYSLIFSFYFKNTLILNSEQQQSLVFLYIIFIYTTIYNVTAFKIDLQLLKNTYLCIMENKESAFILKFIEFNLFFFFFSFYSFCVNVE